MEAQRVGTEGHSFRLVSQAARVGSDDVPVEIYVNSTQQRIWVARESLIIGEDGVRLKDGAKPILGVIYSQFEDATNPPGIIYSTFDTMRMMIEDPTRQNLSDPEWKELARDFDIAGEIERLSQRITILAEGLKDGSIVILGLNAEKFKRAMLILMSQNCSFGWTSIAQGSSASIIFEKNPSMEAQNAEGPYRYFYYPDGGAYRPQSRLNEYASERERLRTLPAEEFLPAIFEEFRASVAEKPSVDESGLLIEEEGKPTRYHSTEDFAIGVVQKMYALCFAIRTALEEDAPILLEGDAEATTTLREIRKALETAKTRGSEDEKLPPSSPPWIGETQLNA